jgi:hypothetical protein
MHECDMEYDYAKQELPADLAHYYQFLARHSKTRDLHRLPFGASNEYRAWFMDHEGIWAYVCPECKYTFPPGLPGMPGAFRAHIADLDESGCVFSPKKDTKARRKTELARF